MLIARILLPLPIDQTFDFFIPKELEKEIALGQRVRVCFRETERWGIVAALVTESEHEGQLEPVLEISKGPSFSPEALFFCAHIAEHYLAPVGLVVNRVLPRRVSARKERFFVLAREMGELISQLELLSRRAPRQAAVLRFLLSSSVPCSERQLREELGEVRGPLHRLVQKGLIRKVEKPCFVPREVQLKRPSLIVEMVEQLPHGGRTLLFSRNRWEAYLGLIEATLAASKNTLVLAPEILLARQLHTYLHERLGSMVELYHSGLPEGERGSVWERARQGKTRLIVGTRSALFVPLTDVGLVIVDEEQDRAYKQDEMLPYYHARFLALERGKGGFVVLGSFAPSLEAFHAARSGELKLVRPEESGKGYAVRVVDMRGEKGILSEPLITAIDRTLAAGKRILLGVNRRGYFQATLCKGCGRPLRCEHCGVNLTYHVKRAQLVCRLCGKVYTRMVCPHCGSRALRFVGVGSQRLEEEVKNRFSRARVARIDMDTLRAHPQERDVQQVLAEGADILVSTPMIAKGPIIPRLGLVGAIGIDALLALPDFRAAERTYQYLTGLAGRLAKGEVIVQTHYPDHFAICAVASGDYDRFYEQEIAERRELFYPPFSHLARLILTGRGGVQRRRDRKRLSTILSHFEVEVLGPASYPTRRGCEVLLVKGESAEVVRAACIAVRKELSKAEIDLNPARI